MRILVVEDDRDLAEVLGEMLADAAYAVDLAEDGETADELASVNSYDLVILDWTIPQGRAASSSWGPGARPGCRCSC